MAGFVTFSLAGLGFLVAAAVESLPPKPSPLLRHAVTGALASLFILDSLLSALSSSSAHHDPLTPILPLTTLAAAALFLLHSLAGLLPLPRLPLPLLDLLLLFAFLQEILLLSVLRPRTDPDGLEHRYLDLLLVPALTCAAATATAVCLQRPSSPAPRLARAAGLALHGTWFIQMAFSFFSTARAHGCSLLRQSRANFTVLCKTHADSHRGRAIAGLQFNFHLAFLLVVGLGLYAVTAASRGRTAGYRPLNKEMRRMENVSASRYTLDSDDEVEVDVEVEMNGADQRHVGENGLNGSH